MPLPAASYINQLDPTQPTGTQKKYEGDDWFRLIQYVLQTQFPNLGAQAVLPTALQLNTITLAIRVQSPETPPLFPLIAARANRLMVFDGSGNFDTSRSLAQFDLDVSNTNTARNQAVTSAGNAATSESNAATSASNASASATLSQQWATSLTVVSGGLYGSRYYAQQAATSASNAATSEGNAATSATNAAASAVQSGSSSVGTSTTSQSIAAGSKSFDVPGAKNWIAGATRLNVSSSASPANSQRGYVTSSTYNSGTNTTTVTINVDGITGSGTFASWNISTIGVDGPATSLNTVLMTGNTTAVSGNFYINPSTYTLTMPTTPNVGDRIGHGMTQNASNGVWAFGSTKVKGRTPSSNQIVLSNPSDAATLTYANATDGWVEA